MKTITVPMCSLREHPAQMRTEMDSEEMARLTLQVYERGLSPHQPILVAADGDGTYRVVSGHRRWLAALLAEEVRARIDGKENSVDLDFVRPVVFELATRPAEVQVCALCGTPLMEMRNDEGWCSNCENWVGVEVDLHDLPSSTALLDAYAPLTERYGDVEIPVVLFEGDEKVEILALQAANFGQETPDLLGQAKSYAAAVKAGAAVAEIAANTGQSVSRIRAVLGLAKVPEELTQAVVAGTVALGVTAAVARLRKKAQREGMTRYVLERGDCTVEQVQQVASALRKWEPPAVSLDPEVTPQERNQTRVAAAAWAEVNQRDPARAWYAAACAVGDCRGFSLLRWIRALGVEEDEDSLLHRLVPDARCEGCRLRESLQAAPQFSYPHYPCQREEAPISCFSGVFEQDPFYLRVPFGWEEYPGVQRVGGSYGQPCCLSPDDFRQALEAATATVEEDEPGQGADSTGSSGYEYSPPVRIDDIADQRALIHSYIEHHTEMSGARHPVATRCEDCRHHLDGSPTKDPDVPPCQWAARRHRVEFVVRTPIESKGPEVPLCWQFAPARSWNDVIPEHPAPPGVPREWMVAVIREMVQAVGKRKAPTSSSRLACEHLTGRPLKAAESHKGWFIEALESQIGNLSDGQLWTLFTWVTADWMRDQDEAGVYLLPLADGRVLRYTERAWQPPADPGEDEENA